jgi:ribosome maturation protein Sdo1
MLAVIAYALEQADFHYDSNKETPDSMVQSFQKALEDIKKVRFLPPCSAIAPCDPYGSADKPPF